MPRLPPGARFAALQTLAYARDPFSTLQRCVERYGDPFTLKLLPGPIVFTGIPEGIREIFTADPGTFESHAGPFLGPLIGDHSLLLLDGVAHKRERSLLMPPFHGTRMKTYGHLIQNAALKCAAAWSPGQPLVMQAVTQAISLKVIIQAVFGVQREERVRLFMGLIPAYFQAFTSLLVYFPPLRREFGGVGPWSRFKRLAARFDHLIFEEIGSRRREPGDRADILSLLLSARYEDGSAMSDQDLCDELKTLLLAGHETTAVALVWAFYWVHRQPEVYRCLGEELKGLGCPPQPEALAQLPYLSAVCDEALRLYPVVAATVRKLRQPFHLRGYELPVGVAVGAAIALTHLDPMRYPDPMRFQPERFLGRKYTPYEYLPFGGGARRCVGAAFATYEMKIVLGSILAHHGLTLAEDKPLKPRPRTFTIGPERGVRMFYQGPTRYGVSNTLP
ncbi:MAG: cytochrome P450 [Gammaproteobacteria bacterium]